MFKDNKKLVVETMFIGETLKLNLSLKEFFVLLYFDNIYDEVFDMKIVAKTLNMKEEDVLTAYGSLVTKNLIKVNAEKDCFGKIREKVCLDNFYNEIKNDYKMKEKEVTKEDIYSVFEKEFGRTLSSMDCEIINAWIENGFSEELILSALKEAVYNGATSLRYIDKVLYGWRKKNIKNKQDIIKDKEKFKNRQKENVELFDYNWLDDNE